jgi:hypothetical protein
VNAIEILRKAIKHFGPEKQIMVFLGEIAELQEALRSGDRDSIIEEIADVQICLAQRFILEDLEPDFSKTPPVRAGLEEIITQITIQEARRVQGRGWKPLSVYLMESWTREKIESMGISDEVEKIKKMKLKRLARRLF